MTRLSQVNVLHKKSDAPRPTKAFSEKVKTETRRYPRTLLTDQAGEFVDEDQEAYLNDKGITHQQTAAYCYESNAVAERYNQSRSAIVRPALEHAPPSLCAEANTCAC